MSAPKTIRGPAAIRVHPLAHGVRTALIHQRRVALAERLEREEAVERAARVQVERESVSVLAGVSVG